MFASIESLTNLNSAVQNHQENVIVKLNLESCKLVRKKQNIRAISLLKKAIHSIDHDKEIFFSNKKRKLLKAITLNNLGCTVAKTAASAGKQNENAGTIGGGNTSLRKYSQALESFSRALKIELKQGAAVSNPAGTHLNICSMLSKLKRHEEAMEHAQCALTLIKNGSSPAITTDGAGQKSSVLALAHHNLAVEQEVLGHYRAALNSYMAACQCALGGLGGDHKLTKAIHKNANAALTSIERKLQGKRGQRHTAERVRKSREILNSKSKRVGNRAVKRRLRPDVTRNDEKENMVNFSDSGGSGIDGKSPGRYLDFIKEEKML